ncbi:hypothetical protein [Alkaliphilus oremlandii]|uniref:Cobalamin adenosyltransferase n=1 Tax=Alkaliphilus oremlandii (strain OhILAs) TaxID=350688 RepID=A8MJE4_ALKOO|nr:hypothetical protein [Alkaliphilus oremlandii]ABW19926.1 conserved hypothetical protein [Alkaliphilus oremlandii OhILAs]
MKFITEEDLRSIFRKEPFTNYEIKAGEKLTPGGRQFLMDQRVHINEYPLNNGKDKADRKKKELMTEVEVQDAPKKEANKKQFYAKVKSMEALFLLTAEEILKSDVFLAQDVIHLGKEFSQVKNVLKENTIPNSLYKGCTGMDENHICNEFDDCFEITEFHMQLENGRNIIILHRLRCALRELGAYVSEEFEGSDGEFSRGVIGKVNQSINTLSQMICSIVGGTKCQKES